MNARTRASVYRRARGRCEYCRIPVAYVAIQFEIDHVIALKHGGRTNLANLALSCAHCNGFKGSDIAGVDPLTKRIVPLFNPRMDVWNRHFRWSSARLIGLTPRGRATIYVLFMNDPNEIDARAYLMAEALF